MNEKVSAEKTIKDIRRKTRKRYSAETKICIVLEGLRGEESIVSFFAGECIPSIYLPSVLHDGQDNERSGSPAAWAALKASDMALPNSTSTKPGRSQTVPLHLIKRDTLIEKSSWVNVKWGL